MNTIIVRFMTSNEYQRQKFISKFPEVISKRRITFIRHSASIQIV